MHKSYELLHEDETTYKLKHPKGHEITIAKQAVSDAIHQKVRGFARGGRVDSALEAMGADDDSYKAPRTEVPEETEKPSFFSELGSEIGKTYGGITTMLPESMNLDASGSVGQMQMPGSYRPQPEVQQPPQTGLIASNGPIPRDSIPIQQPVQVGGEAVPTQVPTDQGGTPQPSLNPNGNLQKSMEDIAKSEISGVNKIAKAKDTMYSETLKAQDDANKAQAAADTIYNKSIKDQGEANERLAQDIASSKINPNRLWADSSTGGKIAAGIGILLSGIGSGLRGGKNQALEVINKMVDQDIDAQKAELGKKQTLYSMNLQKTKDANTAYAMTKTQIAAALQGQISSAGAKAGSPMALAQAQIQNAEIQKAMVPLYAQIAQQQTTKAVMDHIGKTGDVAYAGLLPQKEREEALGRAVPGYGLATTKEGAAKLKPLVASHKVITSNLDILKNMAGENFNSLSPTQRDKAQVVMTDTMMSLKNLYELGVLSGPDKDLIDSVLKNPADAFSIKTFQKIQNLQESIDRRLDSSLVSENIKPPKRIKEKPQTGAR